MYPRNAASPERIAIGPVVLIADGTVQTSGVTVRIIPFGGSEADGAGTTAYSTDGVVVYTPTQAETNYTSFVLIAKKSACIPANVTVVTSASSTAGHAGTDQGKIANSTSTVNLSNTTIKTATDIETDTQDIQNRLPAALVEGRIVAVAQSVTDKNGYSLTQAFPANFNLLSITSAGAIASVINVLNVDELGAGALTANGAVDTIPPAVWNALTTDTYVDGSFGDRSLISTNNTREVAVTGSHHVAAVLHDAEPNSIPEDAFVTGALSARALNADAATEIATAVGTLQVLTRLDSMIESDGAGQFRFDTIALEMAPAGGGGGGTDWTANERTAIRAILGVPTSGTTPTDPTAGILDTIRDSIGGSSTINVYPVSASTPERVAGTTITYYRNEIRSVSVVTDFTLTSLTLVFVVEDAEGTDLLSIPNSSISRSDKTFTVSIGTAVTATISNYRWALRDITGGSNSVIARGVLTVQEAASA